MVAALVDVVWWVTAFIGLLWLAALALVACMLLVPRFRPWSTFVLFAAACVFLVAVFG